MSKRPGNYTHIFKYTGVFGGIQGLNIMVSLVRNKLVAMILGPQGMGLVSIFTSTVKLLSDSTNLGLPMSAVRKISEAYERGRQAEWLDVVRLVRSWSLLTAFLGTLLCALCCVWLNAWAFPEGHYALHFVCLSPLVGLTALMGGELAILKGTRHLGQLARISVYNVLAATCVSIPIYWFYGEAGIVPSLVLTGVMQMLLTVAFSWRRFPYRVSLSPRFLGGGIDIVRLGLAFVLAGVVGSGVDFLIRTYLNCHASMATVGLFNAGYMMAVTYAGMVFSALESDYFPRLSAVCSHRVKLCHMVNSQTEVCVILIVPMLVAFIIGMPLLLPLMFSHQFLPVAGMIQVSALSMFCKALYLPIEYIPLAKGDSRSYFLLELVNDVCMLTFVLVGFTLYGLDGAGWGLFLSSALETGIAYAYAHFKYGYVMSVSSVGVVAKFLPWLVLAYVLTLTLQGVSYWVGGACLVGLASAQTLRTANEKSDLWNKLKERMRR